MNSNNIAKLNFLLVEKDRLTAGGSKCMDFRSLHVYDFELIEATPSIRPSNTNPNIEL